MIAAVRESFLEVCDGWSTDRVVADPELNARFLRACRDRGLTAPDRNLNLRLFNARKAGMLKGLPPARKTSFADEDEYRFASEVAARILEQRHAATLDVILADPNWAQEFDEIARGFAPGYQAVHYRWAALNLRKAKRLRPELMSRIVPTTSIELGPLDSVSPESLPTEQGLYVFYSPAEVLYVGEAANLRRRLEQHLDHSDNKMLARWFWERGTSAVQLEVRTLPSSTTKRVRRALEAELIRSRNPVFNIQR